ncbi:MAG TPA: hypothetical protein VK348_16030 [Planctomycetota bacterium]|nr:hypothetical protein [Planctomycetota bacterium]
MRTRRLRFPCRALAAISTTALAATAGAQAEGSAPAVPLLFPGLVNKAEREAGNPLATYAALLDLEAQYRSSKPFAGIYPEVRATYAEFLGVPLAGVQAMSLPMLRQEPSTGEQAIDPGFAPEAAVAVIARAAAQTRLVIFGEEHHLPQTRSLYEPLLRELWQRGYRYLAAETFTPAVMTPAWKGPGYDTGYYIQDPVYASAVRTARQLGYQLIAYDTAERGPQGDGSFRDRTQAQTLERLVFARDPKAKLLVFAGRGHAAEVPPPDGWTPMASVLKQITGIDPFTIYAPTMSQRQTPAEEHALYRWATAHDLVQQPVIFVDRRQDRCLGSGNCDAWVFWPRVTIVDGRPDWLAKTLGRKAVPIPAAIAGGHGLRLAQAFADGEPATFVPVDQVLLRDGEPLPVLMLPAGSFWLRVIDAQGTVAGPAVQKVQA